MGCLGAVTGSSGRFHRHRQQPCRPQGSVSQRRPQRPLPGWLEVLREMWLEKAGTPKGPLLRGPQPMGNLHQSGDPFLRGLHPRHIGNTPEGQPSFPRRCLFRSLNCPGQSNGFSPWIIPVTLLNLLHLTVPGEASFFHKLFENYTCKRILCVSWRYAQHNE